MHILVRIPQWDVSLAARIRVNDEVPPRCPRRLTTESIDTRHTIIDLSKTPGADLLPVFLVVLDIIVVLLEDVVEVQVQQVAHLAHHPGQRDIREFLVLVAAADVAVDAGEPALAEARLVAWHFLPDGGGEGGAAFVEGERLEGVLDAVGEARVVEAHAFRGRGLDPDFLEPADSGGSEGTDGFPDADCFDRDA